MKKILLLVAVLGLNMSLSATEMKKVSVQPQRATCKKALFTENDVLNKKVDVLNRAPQVAYDDCDYYFAKGMKYAGLDEEWRGYIGIMVLPAVEVNTLQNIYGPTTWNMGSSVLAVESETADLVFNEHLWYTHGINEAGSISGFYTPATEDHEYVAKDGKSYLIKGYSYGEGEANGGLLTVAPVANENGCLYLTQCGMVTNTIADSEGDTRDFYIVGTRERGKYTYGSKTRVAEDPTEEKYPEAIAAYIEVNGALFIQSIVMSINSGYDTPNRIEDVIPEGAEVTMTLYPIVDGMPNKDSIIAQTVMTSENIVMYTEEYGSGSLKAEFKEVDDFGIETAVPVIATGDFLIEFTGINDCDFGFLSDYYNPVGSTYLLIDGEYTQFWSNSANLLINFEGYMPSMIDLNVGATLVFPQEGGYGYYEEDVERETFSGYSWIVVASNLDADMMFDEQEGLLMFSAPENIELAAFDDSSYAEEDYFGAVFATEVANEGYDQEGEIVFFFDEGAMPLEIHIPYFQAGLLGPMPEGIENATIAPKAEKTILDGQLLIKKGDKTFNAMGQQVK